MVEIFIFFDTNTGLSVENLIDVLGEPSWIFVNDQPNILCRYFKLIYPTLGVYVDLDIPEGQKEIQPLSRILIIRFMQTKLSEKMQVYDGYLVKWDGYKKYC